MHSFDKAKADAAAIGWRDRMKAKLEACAVAYCRTCHSTSFVEDEAQYREKHAWHDYQLSR